MLAFINGVLREKYEGIAVIECGGMGYEVILTNSAFCNLPDVDEQVKLPTYLLIREDEWLIFGFSTCAMVNQAAESAGFFSTSIIRPSLSAYIVLSFPADVMRNTFCCFSTGSKWNFALFHSPAFAGH